MITKTYDKNAAIICDNGLTYFRMYMFNIFVILLGTPAWETLNKVTQIPALK